MGDGPGRTFGAGAGILALAVLVTAGCGGSGGQAASADTGNEQPQASLSQVGESGVQGTARMTRGAGAWTLKLELLGVQEGETYPARLVQGSCESGGETVTELDTPHVGTIGVGSSLTRFDTSRVDEQTAHAIVVESPDGSVAACGALDGGRG